MQMKMFLTRMGQTAQFVITGDMSQVDLPNRQRSGLSYALDIIKDVEGIEIVRLSGSDVIRHPLVKRIIDAFDKAEELEKATKFAKENEQNDKNDTNESNSGFKNRYSRRNERND
jgi:phosphate starvation-inducible protein PhoH and related proteins